MDYASEFLGTFALVAVVLFTGNPVAIVLTLLAVIYISIAMNGKGLINPAVSLAVYLKGDISDSQTALYVAAQIAGAVVAALLYSKYKMNNP